MKKTILCLVALTTSACTTTTEYRSYDEVSTLAPAPVYAPASSYATAPAYPVYTDPAYTGVRTTPESPYAMSYTQLSHCVELDRNAKAGAAEIATANDHLNARRAQIDREAREIEARRHALNTRRAAEVNNFNREVADLAAFTTDYNADTSFAQTRANAVNQMVAEYNSNCANRPYHLRDMQALTGSRFTRLGGP